MLGMANDTYRLLDALVTIIGLVVLITHFKANRVVSDA